MKQQQFLITLGLAGLSLLLCLWVIVLNSSNRSSVRTYQEKLIAAQKEKSGDLNKIPVMQNIGTAIIKDMGEVALKNEAMKELLRKQGIEVRPNATPAPALESDSKPADKPADKPAAGTP